MSMTAGFLGLVLAFASLAKGAHDLWAATLVYLLILVSSLILFFQKSWKPSSSGLRLGMVLPLLILIFVFWLSFLKAVHPRESFFELMDWAMGALLFLMALQVLESQKQIRIFLFFMVPVFCLQLIVNVISLFPYSSFLPQSGTLINPNVAAGFCLFWIPVFLDKWKSNNKSKEVWIWQAGLIALVINLCLTRSALAWISLILILPFLWPKNFFLTFFKKTKLLSWLIIDTFLIILITLIITKWVEIYGWSEKPDPMTATSRMIWWKAALLMFLDHPWIGVGIGNFPSAYLAYQVGSGQHTLFAHSWFFNFLAETGGLGLSAFLIVLFSLPYRKIEERRPYFIGLLLFLFFGLFNLSFEYLINVLIFFIFLGVILAPTLSHHWKPKRSLQIILGLLGFSLIPFLVAPFMASQNFVYAEEQYQKKNWKEAFSNYQIATELDPRYSKAFEGWARLFYRRYQEKENLADLHNAIRLQERSLQLNQLNGKGFRQLGDYFIQAEEDEKAAAAYARAHELKR